MIDKGLFSVCRGDSLSEVTVYQLKTILYNCATSSLTVIVLYEHMTSKIDD